jgi:hypothetical protein
MKKWTESRTIWVNGLTTLLAITSALTPEIPPHFAPILAITTSILNIGLRFVTSTAIGTDQTPKQ